MKSCRRCTTGIYREICERKTPMTKYKIIGYLNCPDPKATRYKITARTKIGAALKYLYLLMFYDYVEVSDE